MLKEQNGTTLRLECIGKIDTSTAPDFRIVHLISPVILDSQAAT